MEKGNIFTHIKRLAKFIASKVTGKPATEKNMRFASDREMEIAIGKLVARKKAEQQNEKPTRKPRKVKKSAVQLFYNPREEAELQAIIRAFQPGNFDAIQRRLQKCGCNKGFACLFHGTPGTGKTATAYHFAEQTGREVIRVEVAGLRNRWIGESEKNFHKVFTDYRQAMKTARKEGKPVPILLFNEADAIFSHRLTDLRESADQLMNTLQNILLQEMEDFEGIMIATTNLTENLDEAFDRRFIYKVLFDNPTAEVAARIWQSRLPFLTADEAMALANDFRFSGGQIDNIVRKQIIYYVLNGTNPDIEEIRSYCRQEQSHKKSRRVVGF